MSDLLILAGCCAAGVLAALACRVGVWLVEACKDMRRWERTQR